MSSSSVNTGSVSAAATAAPWRPPQRPLPEGRQRGARRGRRGCVGRPARGHRRKPLAPIRPFMGAQLSPTDPTLTISELRRDDGST
jgi:hypothetical protein